MTKITQNSNLNKCSINNNKAYEGRIGFDSQDNTVVKWYEIRGHKGAQILHFVTREARTSVFGMTVVAYQ